MSVTDKTPDLCTTVVLPWESTFPSNSLPRIPIIAVGVEISEWFLSRPPNSPILPLLYLNPPWLTNAPKLPVWATSSKEKSVKMAFASWPRLNLVPSKSFNLTNPFGPVTSSSPSKTLSPRDSSTSSITPSGPARLAMTLPTARETSPISSPIPTPSPGPANCVFLLRCSLARTISGL